MVKAVQILSDNLREHPAVQAWNTLQPQQVEPVTIDVIKPWKGHFKSAIYRLAGVGPGGAAVIAKRSPLATAALERPIYQEFLPSLPVRSLEYYGGVAAADGQSFWLFMEEASGEPYSPLNPEHRVLAARWLAAVHTAGRRHGWQKRLPDRGPEQYLQTLQSCRVKFREQAANPRLTPEGRAVLEAASEQCEVLESRWSELEKIYRTTPRTLVHGDFALRNVLVRASVRGPEVVVFDWEFAGWGVPGTDLAQHTYRMISPDLDVYRSCLEGWPEIADETQLRRWAACGKYFRMVDVIWWTSFGLSFERALGALVRPIRDLSLFVERVSEAMSKGMDEL